MDEKQCSKALVRYDFQVVLEDDDDDDDEVHSLLMDSWIYLGMESEEGSSDEENEEQFVHNVQHAEKLSNVREKSCDEIQVTVDESLLDLGSSHASQAIPYASTKGETQVLQTEPFPVVCLPHTSQTVFLARTKQETPLIKHEFPPMLSCSQTFSFASTSQQSQVTKEEPPQMVSSMHTSLTLPHGFTSGETQVMMDELPPHTSRTLPCTSTSGKSKMICSEPSQMVSLPIHSHLLPCASLSGVDQEIQTSSRVVQKALTKSSHTLQTLPYTSSSMVREETSDKLSYTSQTLLLASSSRVGQESCPKSPHTSKILPSVTLSKKGQIKCYPSQRTPNPQESDVQKGLNIQRTVEWCKPKKKYRGVTSQNDFSSEALASPLGLGSKTETIRPCADAYQLKMVDDSDTSHKSPSVMLSPETRDIADVPHSLSAVHTSRPFITTHKLETENIDLTYPNASKSVLSKRVESAENSVAKAKRKLPDDEIVICVSDDESVSDNDVVCLEPCKCAKPFHVCKPENSVCKKAAPKEPNDILRDITIIKDTNTRCRPRRIKSAMPSTSNNKPEIIVEKIMKRKFNNDAVLVLSPSKLNTDRWKKKGIVSRNLFGNDKNSGKNKCIGAKKEMIHDVVVL